MNEHIFTAIQAAVEAGKAILEVYARPVRVEYKEDNSPLTEADRKAHSVIANYLKDSGIPLLSEEGKSIAYDERKNWEIFWLVDPLDGTKEFIRRNGEFTVNIALIQHRQPIAGVVYSPVKGLLYFSIPDKGSFRMHLQLPLPETLEKLIADAQALPCETTTVFTVVASRSHMSPETSDYIDALRATHGRVELISSGSSLKLCLVAEGSAQVYPRFAPTMEWDTAAGHAICIGSRKQVVDPRTGKPLLYNKEDLLNPWFIAG